MNRCHGQEEAARALRVRCVRRRAERRRVACLACDARRDHVDQRAVRPQLRGARATHLRRDALRRPCQHHGPVVPHRRHGHGCAEDRRLRDPSVDVAAHARADEPDVRAEPGPERSRGPRASHAHAARVAQCRAAVCVLAASLVRRAVRLRPCARIAVRRDRGLRATARRLSARRDLRLRQPRAIRRSRCLSATERLAAAHRERVERRALGSSMARARARCRAGFARAARARRQ